LSFELVKVVRNRFSDVRLNTWPGEARQDIRR